MSNVLNREGDEDEPLLVRSGVRRIELVHEVDTDTGDVTIYHPDDGEGTGATQWITSDTAFEGVESR